MHLEVIDSNASAGNQTIGNGRFGLGRVGGDGRFVLANPSLSEFLGFSAEEFSNMMLTDIVHPDDLDQMKIQLEQVFARKARGFSIEIQVLPKGLAPIWAVCQLLAIYNEDGSFQYCSLIISELPGYSQTVTALQASERRYKTLLSNLGGVAYQSTPDGKGDFKLRYVSDGTHNLFGIAPERLMSGAVTPADLVHPDDFGTMRAATRKALDAHETARNLFRVLQPDGNYRWALETCRGVYDVNGDLEALEGFITDIHEQKLIEERLSQSEQALIERERQYKTLLSNLMGVAFRLYVTAEGYRLNYVSDGLRDLFGVEPEALLSGEVKMSQLLDKTDRAAIRSSIDAAVNNRTSFRNVVRGRQPDGSFRWMVMTMRGVFNDSGTAQAVEGLITDIHEQKEAEERLYRSEQKLREAHELVGLGRWEHDHKTGVVVWSDETYRIFGQNPDSFTPTFTAFQSVLHPEDREIEAAASRAAIAGRTPYDSVHRIIRPDGDVRYIAERGDTTYDDEGRPLITVGTTLDVTDLKRAELALVEEQAFKNALLETSDFAVVACDENGVLKMFNRSAREWHGMDAMSIPAEDWSKHYDLYGPDGIRPLKTGAIPLVRALNGETVRDAEMSIVRPGKAPRNILCNGAPLFDTTGRKLGAMVIMRDVTRQRMTEANLRQRDAILSAVAFAAERLLTTWDWEQEIETILSTMGQAMHASRAYVLRAKPDRNNRTFASVLYEWCAPDIEPTFIWSSPKGFDMAAEGLGHWAERMQLGGVMQTRSRDFLPAEKTMMDRDNIKAIIAIPLFVHGEWWGILGFDDCKSDRHWSLAEQEALRAATNTIASAIERRRQQEDRLARVVAEEANHAKSAFLATMSHEIRTPMNAILGLSEVLNQSPLTEEQSDLLTGMHDAGRHLLNLIDDILDISKIEAGQVKMMPSDIRISETVEAVVGSLINTAADKGVMLHAFVAPELPCTIHSDGLRLRQVIYNLLGNAIKFSAEITERTGRVELRVDAEEGERMELRITVRDNGIGMSEELMERVFEPFAQGDSQLTRRYGGTGLGLAITRRIVAMMGGRVSVFSTPGEGSTFTLNIPVEVVEHKPPVGHKAPLVGQRCVVMESDSYISNDIVAYLRHAGAEVIEAGTKASPDGEVSLLICGPEQVQNVWSLPDVPHLMIEPGRGRRARVVSELITAVDGTGLSYGRLVEAVSLAIGLLRDTDTDTSPEAERGYADYTDTMPVLVAEDDLMNQKVIQRQLALLKLRSEIASNGADALALARSGQYSMLLTDLHMPDMDGYALARHIRSENIQAAGSEGGRARLPILALTADARQQVIDAVNVAEIDGLLIKPITLKALDGALRPWLIRSNSAADGDASPATDQARAATGGRHEPGVSLPTPALQTAAQVANTPEPAQATPPEPENGAPVLDLAELAARIGDDAEMQREFLHVFRDQMTPLAAQIHIAAEATDLDKVGALAHRLKSTSRAVGAMNLGAICARIEDACRKEDTDELSPLLTRFGASTDAVAAAIANAVGSASHVRH